MAERSEMAVPWWSSEIAFGLAITGIFSIATVVGIFNLFFRVEYIASSIWLALMALIVFSNLRDNKSRIESLGFFVRKQFVESMLQDNGSVEIGYGFQLFGYRFFYNKVPLDKIDTVKWSPEQSPRFWIVCIWYYHGDLAKRLQQRQKQRPRPEHDCFCIGPSRLRTNAEAFGLALVDFLRRAGATMVPGKDDCTYLQETARTTENEKQPVV